MQGDLLTDLPAERCNILSTLTTETPSARGRIVLPEIDRDRGRALRTLLRVPLFIKIALAGAVLLAVAGAGGFLLSGPLEMALGLRSAVAVWAGMLAFLIVGNGTLVHLALRPIRSIETTARRIEGGDSRARIPASSLEDPEWERIRLLLNRMLDTLEETHRRQLALADRLQEAEEEERRRIADLLLADPAQLISATLLHIRRGEQHLQLASVSSRRHDAARLALGQARTSLLEAIEAIRGIARGLRPPELDELGPTVALRMQARHLEAETSVRVRIQGDLVDPWLDERGAVALYRVLRDGLRHVLASCPSDELRVHLSVEDGCVRAEVQGAGPDAAFLTAVPLAGGETGISRMLSQARLAGGSLELRTGKGEETLLTLTLPRLHEPRYEPR
jgi:signal transduction histidine kinase